MRIFVKRAVYNGADINTSQSVTATKSVGTIDPAQLDAINTQIQDIETQIEELSMTGGSGNIFFLQEDW